MTEQTPTQQDTLSTWLQYMASIHVSAIDMGLERVLPVFERLGITKNAFVFMVAGTNGKGSTTATIAQICQNAGLKVALYQSPHLVSFNERIQLDGQMVDDQTLIHAFWQVEQARLACGLSLSFFEMTTLAALYIFAQEACDVWVLEVGLGGRLDVVNVIDANVCVITNVAIDHTDWLGDTREQIGLQKAGILREEAVFVYGESDMPAVVRDIATQKSCRVYQYGRDFDYEQGDGGFIYSSQGLSLSLPMPRLALHNVCVAISAVLASGLNVGHQALAQAVAKVSMVGRFDVRYLNERLWVFDVAHNEAGVQFLLEQFMPFWQKNADGKALYAVFSMLIDKDMDKVLELIKQSGLVFESWHIAPLDNARTMTTQAIANKIKAILPTAQIYEYPTMAQAALTTAKLSAPQEGILVFGSFHTIAESLVALGEYPNPKSHGE